MRGTVSNPVSPVEVLSDLVEVGLVREKADKNALRRLAEWVDMNCMVHGSTDELAALVAKMQEELNKLKKQVRQLMNAKKAEPTPTNKGLDGGDLTILASKPLQGFRCMSCDRPLDDKYQDEAGPFLPSNAFPGGRTIKTGLTGLTTARTPTAIEARREADTKRVQASLDERRLALGGHQATGLGSPTTTHRSGSPPGSSSAFPAKSVNSSPPRNTTSRPGSTTGVVSKINQHQHGGVVVPPAGTPGEKVPASLLGPRLPPGGYRPMHEASPAGSVMGGSRPGSSMAMRGGRPFSSAQSTGMGPL